MLSAVRGPGLHHQVPFLGPQIRLGPTLDTPLFVYLSFCPSAILTIIPSARVHQNIQVIKIECIAISLIILAQPSVLEALERQSSSLFGNFWKTGQLGVFPIPSLSQRVF